MLFQRLISLMFPLVIYHRCADLNSHSCTIAGIFIDGMIMVVSVEISRVIINMEQCRHLFGALPCESDILFCCLSPNRLLIVLKWYFCFSINVDMFL